MISILIMDVNPAVNPDEYVHVLGNMEIDVHVLHRTNSKASFIIVEINLGITITIVRV